MSNELNHKRIAFLFTEGVEQIELEQPLEAVCDAGAQVDLISLSDDDVRAYNHLDKGDTFPIDHAVADVRADDYDGLVLPGGVSNPDALRIDADAVAFIRGFFEQDKPVGVICHGPWTLIEAGVLEGRTITSWPSLQTDIRNAGGIWVDEEVHVDNGLVSSRKPDDLPAFCRKLVEELAEGKHAEQHASVS